MVFIRCPQTCPHGDRCKFAADGADHEIISKKYAAAHGIPDEKRFACSMPVCPCNEPFDPFLTELARRLASKPYEGEPMWGTPLPAKKAKQ